MFSSLRTEVDGYLSHMLATDLMLLLFNIPQMEVKVIFKKKPTKKHSPWTQRSWSLDLHGFRSVAPSPPRISTARAHQGKDRRVASAKPPQSPNSRSLTPVPPSPLDLPDLCFSLYIIFGIFITRAWAIGQNLWARTGHYFRGVFFSELLTTLLGTSGWFWQL